MAHCQVEPGVRMVFVSRAGDALCEVVRIMCCENLKFWRKKNEDYKRFKVFQLNNNKGLKAYFSELTKIIIITSTPFTKVLYVCILQVYTISCFILFKHDKIGHF